MIFRATGVTVLSFLISISIHESMYAAATAPQGLAHAWQLEAKTKHQDAHSAAGAGASALGVQSVAAALSLVVPAQGCLRAQWREAIKKVLPYPLHAQYVTYPQAKMVTWHNDDTQLALLTGNTIIIKDIKTNSDLYDLKRQYPEYFKDRSIGGIAGNCDGRLLAIITQKEVPIHEVPGSFDPKIMRLWGFNFYIFDTKNKTIRRQECFDGCRCNWNHQYNRWERNKPCRLDSFSQLISLHKGTIYQSEPEESRTYGATLQREELIRQLTKCSVTWTSHKPQFNTAKLDYRARSYEEHGYIYGIDPTMRATVTPVSDNTESKENRELSVHQNWQAPSTIVDTTTQESLYTFPTIPKSADRWKPVSFKTRNGYEGEYMTYAPEQVYWSNDRKKFVVRDFVIDMEPSYAFVRGDIAPEQKELILLLIKTSEKFKAKDPLGIGFTLKDYIRHIPSLAVTIAHTARVLLTLHPEVRDTLLARLNMTVQNRTQEPDDSTCDTKTALEQHVVDNSAKAVCTHEDNDMYDVASIRLAQTFRINATAKLFDALAHKDVKSVHEHLNPVSIVDKYPDRGNRTPLHEVIFLSSPETEHEYAAVFDALLDYQQPFYVDPSEGGELRQADLTATDNNGLTPFGFALAKQCFSFAQKLAEKMKKNPQKYPELTNHSARLQSLIDTQR